MLNIGMTVHKLFLLLAAIQAMNNSDRMELLSMV